MTRGDVKRKTMAAVAVVALITASGCRERAPATGPAQGASQSDVERMEKSITNAFAATKQYVYENKNREVAAIQESFQNVDAWMDALAKQSTNYTGQAKAQAEEALTELRAQRTVLAKQLVSLKRASKDTWQVANTRFDRQWQKFKKMYEKVHQEFQD